MRIEGRHWHVWRARGSLYQRQIEANRAGCVAAFEQHLNSAVNKDALYAMVIVAANASEKSREWGRDYCERVSKVFDIRNGGVVVDPPRGPFNIKFYQCPAILLEPGFISNKEFADRVETGEGIDALARCAVASVCAMFPEGGLIGCSVGHAYRGVNDPGAPTNDEGDALVDPAFDSETELNEAIVKSFEEMLLLEPGPHEADTEPPPAII